MGFIANLSNWLARPPSAAEHRAVQVAIDCVDPRLRLLPGYERRLAPAVRHALAYCEGLVAAIPGPVDISVRAFGADPLVHALFAAPEDIGHMLAASQEVQRFVADPANDAEYFFAMIGMRRKEKVVTGIELHGDVIQEGVQQRLLYFADHTLHEPSQDIEKTRDGLRAGAFESLAKGFAAHLAELRHAREDLRRTWEEHRALARLGGRHDPDGAHAHEAAGLEHAMRDAARELEPGRVLEALAAWLAAPESRLHLEETSLAVDRLGVIADAGTADAGVRTLSLPELVGRDRRRWIVLLVRIARTDAMRAQQDRAHAGRYIVI